MDSSERREAARRYKESRRPMGIYQVRNTVSGRVLIGTSVDLPSMLNRQQAQLRLGAHRNRDLQQDWNALGAGAFTFDVLDTLEPPDEPGYDPAEDLRVLEQLWLDRLTPFGERGYNAKPKPGT
jgi:hypothetical protein